MTIVRTLGSALATLAVVLVSASAASAWEARAGRICELVHDGEAGHVRVTYDPAIREYAIAITVPGGWSGGPVFAMRFDGPGGLTISTTRHVLSEGGATLTVTDTGFGNVLDGLEYNATANALLDGQAAAFSLEGAAPEVRAFRACTSGVIA